ncbi:MAG TPA: diacylglycerol kinase family protein [Chloroflexota bacterium]|nr:diacylglycerol kinase family protein [Chloroflexota bacterium]
MPRATIREVTALPQSSPTAAPATRSRPGAASTSRRRSEWRVHGSVLNQERASFGYAWEGIRYAWRTQRHLRIHVSLALLAVGLGLFFTVSPAEWAALLTAIALVMAFEMLNTVIEAVVDLVTGEFHPNAKVAKDVGAGAVLVTAAGAALVGAVIFIPRLWIVAVRLAAGSTPF